MKVKISVKDGVKKVVKSSEGGCCGGSCDCSDNAQSNKSQQSCCPDTGCSTSCCCEQEEYMQLHCITGTVSTPVGDIPQVATVLTHEDKFGAFKVRWGIGRMKYKIEPKLYCVGSPDSNSPVFVTANYKLTFDALRKELGGINAWILVLDTKGINVWCAAGKGTFGTDELVSRIEKVRLSEIVSHKTVIVPQLGAPGIAAHKVLEKSGFRVQYGPVKASDLPAYIKAGNKATDQMRQVTFTLWERLVVSAVDIFVHRRLIYMVLGVYLALALTGITAFSAGGIVPYIAAILTGVFGVAALLPYIPFRSFAAKGWLLGAVLAAVCIYAEQDFTVKNISLHLLTIPPIVSYIALNFTGSSTYTSLSGVIKETRAAMPFVYGSAALGVVAAVTAKLLNM